MDDPSIVSTLHYFLHNGELTLLYFLTECGLFSGQSAKNKRVFASHPQHNAFNTELFSQLLSFKLIRWIQKSF